MVSAESAEDCFMLTSLCSRRELLCRIGGGIGAVGLANVFADVGLLAAAPANVNPLAPRQPHFPARAKRLIFLFMNGGPSHVDTFDPKPALTRHNGQPLRSEEHTSELQSQSNLVCRLLLE